MSGIVLVTKPSFLFPADSNVILKNSWIKVNNTQNWRNEYEKGIFFLFDLKSKFFEVISK